MASVGADVLSVIPSPRSIALPRSRPWSRLWEWATSSGNSEERTAQVPHRGARQLCVLALATSGGAGFAPVAPGTFGALVGVGLFALLAGHGPLVLGLVLAALTVVGVWAAGEAEHWFGRHDDGRIVIDEVAGQMLTLLPLSFLAAPERALEAFPLLLGFAAFRAIDIAKPLPVRWAERRLPGGLGVMADDLVAGALAAAAPAAVVVLGRAIP